MTSQRPVATSNEARVETMGPIDAAPLSIDEGFEAISFKHKQFDGLMDPLVMVDHYTMTAPTFGPHPHAGMSAVTVLFEDSEGAFNNRDSLGNDIDLAPGDLYWLKAGSGAVHDEKPKPGARAHGLQIFVNLPAALKGTNPASLHVKAADMPSIKGDGHRVRVVLGSSNGIEGAHSPALPLTILDGALSENASFDHELGADRAAWIHAVEGEVAVEIAGTAEIGTAAHRIPAGQALAVRNGGEGTVLSLGSEAGCRFALIEGTPIRESFVQRGPFVMSSEADLDRVKADFEAGRLGSID